MWARVGRGETDLEALLHVWGDRCYALPEPRVVRQPRWIIDAGANAGYATRWFADTFPMATVIAIEPDPSNVALLRLNTAHSDNVVIEEAALSDTVGSADLVDVGEGPWAMRVGNAGGGDGKVVGQVNCVTVDDIIARHGIGRIGFFKVDIEGGELEVFRSSQSWIDRVDVVAAELHDRFRPGTMRAFVAATDGFATEFSRGEDSFAIRAS